MATQDSSQNSDITRENEKVPSTSVSSLSSYLKVEVSPKHADLVFLGCCVVSGLCDSSVYASWQCFVSMQTGLFTDESPLRSLTEQIQETLSSSLSVPRVNRRIVHMVG